MRHLHQFNFVIADHIAKWGGGAFVTFLFIDVFISLVEGMSDVSHKMGTVRTRTAREVVDIKNSSKSGIKVHGNTFP